MHSRSLSHKLFIANFHGESNIVSLLSDTNSPFQNLKKIVLFLIHINGEAYIGVIAIIG